VEAVRGGNGQRMQWAGDGGGGTTEALRRDALGGG